jgi:hypothetical protein
MDAWLLDQHGDAASHDDPGGEDSDGPDNGEDDAGEEGGGGGTEPPPGRPPPPGGRGRKRRQVRKRRGKRIAARINLTIPAKTLLELGDAPGDAGPFGPLDPAAARDLARTAAAHPSTRWCHRDRFPRAGRGARMRPRT